LADGSDFELRGMSSSQIWEHENAFYWFSEPGRIAKLLAQYEIYKKIVDLPGDVFEFGVYKAASIIRLASFRALLENEVSRAIYGFDAFGKFPEDGLSLKGDNEFVSRFEGNGGYGLTLEETEDVLRRKGYGNINFVKGDVFSTVPKFLEEHPSVRISMLHLDMDVKEPTEFVLSALFDRVVPGGVIMIDDYTAVEGATSVVDDFVERTGLPLRKLPYYSVPAYILK
jgi:uncharacterized protein (UPF0297 family)